MRQHIILLLVIFALQLGFSQQSKKSIYSPQEQLIHPECSDSTDKNACLSAAVEKKMSAILNLEKTKRLFYEDTLSVSITFVVDKRGKIFEDFIRADYSDDIITPRLGETTSYYIKQLPVFKVKNRKPRPYNSWHRFEYKYLIDHKDNKSLTKLETPYKYEGGTIMEVPLFEGCKRRDEASDRECFQKKMQEHIGKNFIYPQEAMEKGISGRVNTMFIIGKDGNAEHLKVKGDHELLEEEAKRIMSLLPKFEPGLINGEPVRVPFSIPVTFKLQ